MTGPESDKQPRPPGQKINFGEEWDGPGESGEPTESGSAAHGTMAQCP
jgi:hypothetical protein